MLQRLEQGTLLHLLHLPWLAALQARLQVPCQPPLRLLLLLLLLQTAVVCQAVLLPQKLLPRLLLLLPLLRRRLLPGLVGV